MKTLFEEEQKFYFDKGKFYVAQYDKKEVGGMMVKNKFLKVFGVLSGAFAVFMAFGWSFFKMTVRYKDHKKQEKKKWFALSHTKVNHPRHKFEKEYEEGKAWCASQEMEECYIRSADGLRLHASYLPADNAKRIVLLSHGYKGSSFGDFAYTARFLHENHCDLLFIDQRCCGESQGEYITFGAKEQFDVQRWAYYIARRNQEKLPVYLYGESMGAAALDRAVIVPLEFVLRPVRRFSHEGCRYGRGLKDEWATGVIFPRRKGYLCGSRQFSLQLFSVPCAEGACGDAGGKASLQCI